MKRTWALGLKVYLELVPEELLYLNDNIVEMGRLRSIVGSFLMELQKGANSYESR